MTYKMAMTKRVYVKFGHDAVGSQPSTEEFNAKRVSVGKNSSSTFAGRQVLRCRLSFAHCAHVQGTEVSGAFASVLSRDAAEEVQEPSVLLESRWCHRVARGG
jgi:hypothetical protein